MSDEELERGERPCRACGRQIRFATGPNGRPIPLSRVANVYQVNSEGNAVPLEVPALWISHFVDCPKAGTFSKRGR